MRSPGVGLLVVLAACQGGAARPDGSGPDPDAGRLDASAVDALFPLSGIDFTASGCAVEGDPPVCSGAAPLAVRFVPLAPAPVDTFLWDLGEGGDAVTEPSPAHTYRWPGSYTVSLTAGGPGGTAQIVREGFVVVSPAPLGAACRDDAQCGSGECVCGAGEACPAPLAGGLCSQGCDSLTPCPAGAVCADATGGAPDATGWRRALCLAECAGDEDCPSGRRCVELPAGDGGGSWVRGCFADVLAPAGASCVDAAGDPYGAWCASGRCLALGARGVCAADCSAGSCPSYAACADLPGQGLSACLARCDDVPCDGDPWLSCEAPNADGAYGFTVGEMPSPGGYCAPRRCTDPVECGPYGECAAGFCG